MLAPNINIAKAIRAYYTKPELSNKDILDLFDGTVGRGRLQTLKKAAEKRRIEMKRGLFTMYCVNTQSALEAWGYNIEEMEANYKRLRKLGLLPPEEDVP